MMTPNEAFPHLTPNNHRITSPASDAYGTPAVRGTMMRKQYDFGKARRGPVVRVAKGKTRITIRLDDDLLRWFKCQVHEAGGGSYQALINAALHEYIAHREAREAEVLAGLDAGDRTVRDLVARIYASYPREVHDLEITRDQALAQARPVPAG